MKMGFDGCIKLEFHGAKVTYGAGLLGHRDQREHQGRRRCSLLQWSRNCRTMD